MSCPAMWQFIRDNPVLAGPIISGLLSLGIALLVHQLQRNNDRKKKRQELAVCWRAVLLELSLALDRMQETTRHLIRNRQQRLALERFHKSDILLHQGLREGFLLRASDQEGAELVMTIHQDLYLFIWNVREAKITRMSAVGVTSASTINRGALERAIDAYDEAAIRFACNRHLKMIDAWKRSVMLHQEFCNDNGLDRGVDISAPIVVPENWQRAEEDIWKLEELPRVGEHTWEP